jgi:hypothetical protein
MRLIEIETWALRIVDQLAQGQPIEDTRVELKTTWPKPQDAARRIAAHANAARGERILWLIGVDEKTGVIGASEKELASWWAAVSACFDEISPRLQDVNVPTDGKVIVALAMETDRAPYVVKNPAGGSIGYEVPWREGTSTRTARRGDLVRMLEPQIHMPSIDVLNVFARVAGDSAGAAWSVLTKVFVAPRAGQELVFPFHRARLEFSNGTCEVSDWTVSIEAQTSSRFGLGSHTVFASESEAVFRAPGTATIVAKRGGSPKGLARDALAKVLCSLAFVHGQAPVVIEHSVPPVSLEGQDTLAMWRSQLQ